MTNQTFNPFVKLDNGLLEYVQGKAKILGQTPTVYMRAVLLKELNESMEKEKK